MLFRSGAAGGPQPVHHTRPVLEAHYLLPSPLQQGGGAGMLGAQDQAPSAALLNSNPTLYMVWIQGLSFKKKIPSIPVNAALLSSSVQRHLHRMLPAHAGPGGQRHDLCYLSNCAISTCARRQARPPSPGRLGPVSPGGATAALPSTRCHAWNPKDLLGSSPSSGLDCLSMGP